LGIKQFEVKKTAGINKNAMNRINIFLTGKVKIFFIKTDNLNKIIFLNKLH
jgi:hypothetical protein